MKKDKFIQKISELSGMSAKKGKCLSEEQVSGLIDGTITGASREKLVTHIISCKECAMEYEESYELIASLEQEGLQEVPDDLIENAKTMLIAKKEKDYMAIIINVGQRIIDVVSTTGELLQDILEPGGQLVPVFRGKGKSAQKDEVRIQQKIKGSVVTVSAAKKKGKKIIVTIECNKNGTRATLVENGIELESKIIRDNKVVFDDLLPKTYEVILSDTKKTIGKILLKLTK